MTTSDHVRRPTRRFGFDPDYLAAFEQKLFIQGPETARRLTDFFALLLLATVIATFGVISASVATVIGAMIVAPLMGPIMATAAAIVMGSARRALSSLGLVVVGVVSVILLSALLAAVVPDVSISFTENPEIVSRTSPGLVALLTALAAGAAGAYITAREDLADSIGGVAIAISLVPPLCVVGISLSKGSLDSAGGALLLFSTNFLAILLAGGIVFLLSGLGRLATSDSLARVRRNAFVLVIAATVLIAIPLGITSYEAVDNALETRDAQAVVSGWLEGTDYQVVSVSVKGGDVKTVVEGSGELRPVRGLANQLAQTLGRPVVVDVSIVPSETQSSD